MYSALDGNCSEFWRAKVFQRALKASNGRTLSSQDDSITAAATGRGSSKGGDDRHAVKVMQAVDKRMKKGEGACEWRQRQDTDREIWTKAHGQSRRKRESLLWNEKEKEIEA
mmetsp:Transcript_19704/g.27511  ORF Transcript_19704/g.27511 Transcript_19704/m.27511 type:complete len:112 (-) Transcript_19704:25-360(-)